MTEREKIIELAEQQFSKVWVRMNIEYLEAFYRAAQADAFEQAAKVCETFDPHPNQWSESFEYTQQSTANACAEAIRQLGKEKV